MTPAGGKNGMGMPKGTGVTAPINHWIPWRSALLAGALSLPLVAGPAWANGHLDHENVHVNRSVLDALGEPRATRIPAPTGPAPESQQPAATSASTPTDQADATGQSRDAGGAASSSAATEAEDTQAPVPEPRDDVAVAQSQDDTGTTTPDEPAVPEPQAPEPEPRAADSDGTADGGVAEPSDPAAPETESGSESEADGVADSDDEAESGTAAPDEAESVAQDEPTGDSEARDTAADGASADQAATNGEDADTGGDTTSADTGSAGSAAESESGSESAETAAQTAAAPDGVGAVWSDGSGTIRFEAGSSALPEGSAGVMDQIAEALSNNPDARAVMEAFATNPEGDESRARRLALSRALAARVELIERGVSARRIEVNVAGLVPDDPSDRLDIAIDQG